MASFLFSKMADLLIEDNVSSYALSHYAHDEEVARSFVLNGFGVRCSDSILRLSEYVFSEPINAIEIREIPHEEKYQMQHLQKGLIQHLSKAPCLFPTDLSKMNDWFADQDKRVFVAVKGEEIIGFMALIPEGENYLTENPSMINICGAYVEPEYRSTGVAKMLLDVLVNTAIKDGYTYLGVDCKTLNPTALRFWGKYFTNYTYSFHRRIDERIVWI